MAGGEVSHQTKTKKSFLKSIPALRVGFAHTEGKGHDPAAPTLCRAQLVQDARREKRHRPGVFNSSLQHAGRQTLGLLPGRASLPSFRLSASAPHPPPSTRLALRHRPAGAGSGARGAEASTAPCAPPSQGRPASRTQRTAELKLGRQAAEDARPARSMDSDSGEQSEGEPVTASGPDVFSSKSLALQAQKKILSKIASKTMANMLIDDTSSEIFDELYKVTKEHTHNKKEAHKIMKDLIKVAIKIGILYRNNQFSPEEVVIVEKFRKKLNQIAMTVVSFYEVEYTFDRNVLSKLLHECKNLVHEMVQRHLTPRTHRRINHVFNHFADVEFLSTLYSLDGDCRPNLKRICEGVNKLLEEKVL
ncbi:tumor necrosis factor alpha-induced protein 8-like protein 3 [Loxodonta africana]